jgi:hypothetical protein
MGAELWEMGDGEIERDARGDGARRDGWRDGREEDGCCGEMGEMGASRLDKRSFSKAAPTPRQEAKSRCQAPLERL